MAEDDDISTALVRAAQTGDRRAQEILLRRVTPVITKASRACPDDVRQDIVQEVQIKVLQSLELLREPAALHGWVRTIAKREIAGWFRRRSRERQMLGEWQRELTFDRDEPVAEKPNGNEPAPDVRAAVHRLPPSQRELIYDHYVLGRSYAETSGQREIPLTALKSRLHRARRRLHKELSKMNQEAAINLAPTDLDAIARAVTFAAKEDPKRPVLEGVLLDNEGYAVATDGHRLLVAEAPGLTQLDTSIIVDVNASTLLAGPASASVRLDELHLDFDEDEIAWPLVTGDFPDYRAVLPTKPKLEITLATADVGAALEALRPHLDDAHPSSAGFTYLPAVFLAPDARSKTIEIGTSQALGYAPIADGPADRPAGLDWHFSVVVPTRSFAGFTEAFRLKVNAHYLCDALGSAGSTITLSFTRPDQSLDLKAGRDRAVIMPIA